MRQVTTCLLLYSTAAAQLTLWLLPLPGNVYFSDYYNHVIRKVTVSTSIITTIAGVASAGYSGDNGPATTAGLYYPYGVALDSSGIDLH